MIGTEAYKISMYINVEKHVFRERYENYISSNIPEEESHHYFKTDWKKMKPLIHVFGPYSAVCPCVGDKVEILKYGFVVYTDNAYTNTYSHGGVPTSVYKHTFIIDREKGRIL